MCWMTRIESWTLEKSAGKTVIWIYKINLLLYRSILLIWYGLRDTWKARMKNCRIDFGDFILCWYISRGRQRIYRCDDFHMRFSWPFPSFYMRLGRSDPTHWCCQEMNKIDQMATEKDVGFRLFQYPRMHWSWIPIYIDRNILTTGLTNKTNKSIP